MSITLKLEGKAWSTFLDVELAPKTKNIYSRYVQGFMEHCDVTDPDKLLDIGTVHQIEDRIISWLGIMKDSGKATATMKTALASIVFFYSSNRVKVDSRFVGRRIPKKPVLPHRSPTKEELAAIVEAANQLGLSPFVYNAWIDVIKPLVDSAGVDSEGNVTGVSRKEIAKKYHAFNHKTMSSDALGDILEQLESAGLVEQKSDPKDKRTKLVYGN